jgi:hypothetical protein
MQCCVSNPAVDVLNARHKISPLVMNKSKLS